MLFIPADRIQDVAQKQMCYKYSTHGNASSFI